MKRSLVILIHLLFVASLQAQPMMSQRLDASIIVMDLKAAQVKLNSLIETHQALILNSSTSGAYSNARQLTLLLSTNQAGFDAFRKELPALGTVRRFDLNTRDNQKEKESIEMELGFYKSQREVYTTEMTKLDPSARNKNYETMWEKARELDQRIFELEKRLLNRKQETSAWEVSLSIEEEHGEPLESADWDFVNMPGLETMVIAVENPKKGVSDAVYAGGGLRYMFTRGKSYLNLQVLKAMNTSSGDSTTARDMFVYGWGSDFYARYFGRGQNQFFNLYSGFVIGGTFMTSETINRHVMHVNPHIGIEIFKNQYMVLDTRVGYFLPLTEKQNQDFRGLTHNLSFNFVF
ncbi:MAG: hypothetical protein HUU10_14215 [Bacteroidetes bacterium]|nr:hypothetical protein [Bacteroidota bacterium]